MTNTEQAISCAYTPCNETFNPDNPKHIYCSDRCRHAAWLDRLVRNSAIRLIEDLSRKYTIPSEGYCEGDCIEDIARLISNGQGSYN